MKNPWSLLTLRGKVFSALGILLTGIGIVLGQRDVLWFGLFLLLLPTVALLIVTRSRLQLSCERNVNPPEAVVGETLRGEIVLTKSKPGLNGLLHFEDTVPPGLGRAPRFTSHRFSGQWRRDIEYPLAGITRGRYHTGPMRVRSTDPFGMVKVDRSFNATSEVMITPHIVPLPSMRNAINAGASGESSPQKVGVVGQDDVSVRDYRAGDDVRRIHWASTARRGEIMVRREEQAWDPAAVVILDSRITAHAGGGPTGSFEWAVSAAASISLHFLDSNFTIDLYDSEGAMIDRERLDHATVTRKQIVDSMTEVQLCSQTSLARSVQAAVLSQRSQLLVAVTGRLTQADVQQLMIAQRNRARCLAFVLDTDTFTSRSERTTVEMYEAHRASIDMLSAAGWRVVEVSRGTDVAEAWATLDRIGEPV